MSFGCMCVHSNSFQELNSLTINSIKKKQRERETRSRYWNIWSMEIPNPNVTETKVGPKWPWNLMSERVGLVLRQTSSATIILLQCGCPCLEWCSLYGLVVIVSVCAHPFHFNFVSIKGMIFATSMVAC